MTVERWMLSFLQWNGVFVCWYMSLIVQTGVGKRDGERSGDVGSDPES